MEDKNSNNLTVWQRLGEFFRDEKTIPVNQNTYSFEQELLKTDSKDAFDVAKLQKQQSIFLHNQYAKVDSQLYQQSIFFEQTRIASYSDFEMMEFYPEIGAALDIIMEESSTTNEQGKTLNIYSESERVKTELDDLFYKKLKIQTTLGMWTRNTAKYGDNFLFLQIDDENGITGAKQLPNIEMERHEGNLFTSLNHINNLRDDSNEADPTDIKFIWRPHNQEFKSWQIAHFRLLTDDRKLPYGVSVLEKARRIHKQLLLAEDAMLIYRVTRAPERRVFKVFVGNLDDKDIEPYVNQVANKFKRTPMVDPKNGQIDLRYNQLPIWRNSIIPLLDGRNITIEDLSKEWKSGKENYVYSIQDDTHKIVAGKVIWCDKNYTAELMVKVWLDDDTYIVTAPEHPFILRDGSKKRADELKENDSLMPFYRKLDNKSNGFTKYYEQVFNPNSGKFEKTHRIISEGIVKKNKLYNTVHHKNFNKYDNSPINLEWVDFHEHKKMHSELAKSQWKDNNFREKVIPKIRKKILDNISKGVYKDAPMKASKTLKKRYSNNELDHCRAISKENLTNYNKSERKRNQNVELCKLNNTIDRMKWYNGSDLHKLHNTIRKNAQIKDWSIPEKKLLRSKSMQVKFDDFMWGDIRSNIISGVISNRKTLLEYINNNLIDHLILINKNKRLNKLKSISKQVLTSRLKEKNFLTTTEFINEQKRNHKVKFIENITGDDVYCMTIVGQNNEDDRHNFACLSFQKNENYSESGIFLGNSQDQDYFIPTRDMASASPIETLPGACLSLETKIPLLDGRTLSLQEIIDEWDSGNRNIWVYSCDPKTGEFAPGIVTWAGITRKNADVMKITLDNGKEIITTPDHKFVHRTNEFIEGRYLNVGDSLMPFYRQEDYSYKKKGAKTYEQVWDNENEKWVFTHRRVVDFLTPFGLIKEFVFNKEFINSDKKIRHHVDINRYNNNPCNLVFMNVSDHYKYHQHTLWSTKEKADINRKKISLGLKKYLSSLSKEDFDKRMERINNPETKAKTIKILLEWCKNPENLKLKGKLISKTKTGPGKHQQYSDTTKEVWARPGHREKVFRKKQTITFTDRLFEMFITEYEKSLRSDLTINALNNDKEFMSEFRSSNIGIRSSMTNLNELTHNHIEKMVKQKGFKNYREWKKNEIKKRGFKNIAQWKYSVDKKNGKYSNKKTEKLVNEFYNHKIIKIEYLTEKIDTGTITVDGNEIYHNYHTFALEGGIYVKNSNLSEIQDIEYLQKKLFAAIRVPKTFLGYEESVGEGKNLALQDVRFARTINRIQQAMIQELNKIAIIHLYILGFDEDIDNFTLTLNNPSTQAEMLKIEHLKEKIELYKSAVVDPGNGFAAMSVTKAKREILNMSNNEIMLDIEQQRLEKAASAELANTAEVIKKTGMFDKVDKIYGEKPAGDASATPADSGSSPAGTTDMGTLSEPSIGSAPIPADVGAADTTPEAVAEPTLGESILKDKLLTESYIKKVKRYNGIYYDRLVKHLNESIDKKPNVDHINNDTNKINGEINTMMTDIDKLVDE